MSERPLINPTSLMVLAGLVAKCRNLEEVRQAIMAYREDAQSKGMIKPGMSLFASRFSSFEDLAKELQKRVEIQAESDNFHDHMEFDEFISGWDDDK